jgi:SAM-dependent methyltransferase
MFTFDPAAALQEVRRVLRPGGRAALAVWDDPELNPWATITMRALVELGHVVPPDRNEPGMFALADAVRLSRLLEDAGFLEVLVDSVELSRSEPSLDRYFEETLDLNRQVADVWERLSERHQQDVRARIAELARPFTADDGSVRFPARSLVAAASA